MELLVSEVLARNEANSHDLRTFGGGFNPMLRYDLLSTTDAKASTNVFHVFAFAANR